MTALHSALLNGPIPFLDFLFQRKFDKHSGFQTDCFISEIRYKPL